MSQAPNRLHSQLTLSIYSLLFQDDIPKDSPESEQYWDDFFNISILEPALIATFNSLDLSNDYHISITSSCFLKSIERFHNSKDMHDMYVSNNLILILNAFMKSLRSITADQSKYYYNQSIYEESDRKMLSNDQLITKLLFNSDTSDKGVMLTFFEILKYGLNEPGLLKSSLSLLLNTLLVFYGTEFFEYFYECDLNQAFYDKVIPATGSDLSIIDYNRQFIIMSILINNSRKKNENIYKNFLRNNVSDKNIFKIINMYLYPIISFNLILLDDTKPDLSIEKSHGASLFNLLTFNKFNKLNNWYRDTVYETLDEELKILLKIKKNYTKEKLMQFQLENEYYESANDGSTKKKSSKEIQYAQIKCIESLSLNLVLYAFVVNNEGYEEYLTSHLNENDVIHHEDEENAVNNLLDLLLSYSSFIFQNQHGNQTNHVISRLNLLIIFKLLTTDTNKIQNNLLSTTIDQFKFKLCHQVQPMVNNFVNYIDFTANDDQYFDDDDISNNQFKVKILYMIDVLQCFLRYNLTANLDIISMKLSVDNILLISNILVSNYNMACANNANENYEDFLLEYNWNELFNTLFGLLKFLNADKVADTKHSSTKYFSLIEEVLILLCFILINNEKLFKYDNYLIEVVYKLLEHKHLMQSIALKLKAMGEMSIYSKIILSVIYFMGTKLGFNDLEELQSVMDFSEIFETTENDQPEYTLTRGHDLDYTQIATALRNYIGEIPITIKTNKLLSKLSKGSQEEFSLTLESIDLLIENSQFEESLKYLTKKNSIFNNYKISLINEGIDIMIKEFDRMFR
ncbi:hypothetical protein DASC09_035590 [Saccharomycopsis crataegensis]|uniref:Armadillo-like helical domain-containing protein n=1 Tax=Saccharomycopsis crataegensis TaxID=43959 RepID=A0AAV5QNC5_9ASCO|nr:hypothetical protein DASC09_035590 [Saccharomycopsis crataegensis]